MNIKKITRISIVILFLATVILSLVPVFQTALKGEYRGVPPAYIDDDLCYYGRMKEVADGKPLIGNPYFIEHHDAVAAAFFVTDWIAAIPLLLGIPFSVAVVLNFIFWSLFFVYLAYLFGRASGMPSPYSAGVAFLAYSEVYWLIFRPVVMQEVFPFFLLFILAFLSWLRHPSRRRSVLLLIAVCASSFYIYMFLWQIFFAVLGVVFVHMLIQKKWPEVRSLLLVVLGTGILSLPVLIYTVHQISSPLYWETVNRIGLVQTYMPSIDAYLYGRWAILLVVLYYCARAWLKTEAVKKEDAYDVVARVAIYSGLGLFIMTVSNLLTGQDIATASHIGRFITLWVALFLPVLIWKLYVRRVEVRKLHWLKLAVIGMLLLACVAFLASNIKRSLPFQRIARVDSVGIQGYAEPLRWIDAREKQPVVIWANDDMSIYVPILTRHYVFWSFLGGLHIMSTQEIEDRFLASREKILTANEIFSSIEAIEGAGVGRRYDVAFNKNKLLCLLSTRCAKEKSMREWFGEEKLNQLIERQVALKKDMSGVMKKYHISYIVVDTTRDEDIYFKSLSGVQEVWKNDRFIVYEIR